MKFKNYLQIKEAAEYLGVNIETLRTWTKKGKIEFIRNPINNYKLFKREDLDSLLASLDNSSVKD